MLQSESEQKSSREQKKGEKWNNFLYIEPKNPIEKVEFPLLTALVPIRLVKGSNQHTLRRLRKSDSTIQGQTTLLPKTAHPFAGPVDSNDLLRAPSIGSGPLAKISP